MADLSLNFDRADLGTPAYGDLVVASGDLLMTSDSARPSAAQGTEPITQAVVQNMRTLLGEFFLDTSLGVPYYQELLGQRTGTTGFETALQNVVLSTPGVTALLSWQVERDRARRRLIVNFRAQSNNGEVVWSGSLNPTLGGGN